jgi:hypothetical protein
LRRIYNTYVSDYSSEQRTRAIGAVFAAVFRKEVLAGLAGAIGILLIARETIRHRRARRETGVEERWFDQLLAVLAPYGLVPLAGETAREFAGRASDRLRRHLLAAHLAEIPLAWAEAYYESRFGGRPISADRAAELETHLEELRAALLSRRGWPGETT